jgi:hypothetical protein
VSHITLPREVVEKIREAWSSEVYPPAASIEWYDIMDALRAALDAALAEPEQPQKARPDFLERVEDTVEENDDAKRD